MATSVLVSFCHTFLILEKFLTLDETESTKKKKFLVQCWIKRNVEILHTNNNSDSIPWGDFKSRYYEIKKEQNNY